MNSTQASLLRILNPAQQQAVQHIQGPLLILAGPGSGKTRVITTRLAYLLTEGIPAQRLAALTFTNKAADEMRSRLKDHPAAYQIWISTFHRFASMLLRRYAPLVGLSERFTILDSEDSLSVMRSVLADAEGGAARCSPQQILHAISRAKNELIGPEQMRETARTLVQKVAAEIYPQYQRRLLDSNAVDFDDLLFHVAQLLAGNPELRSQLDAHFEYIMVDEYQDTNLAQYAIVRGLSIEHANLAVTGDPDQSIYSWRGANIQNILRFEADFPGARVVRLEQNYRSTPAILDVADQLIAHNRMRKQKRLFTQNPPGPRVQLTEYADQDHEAQAIARTIADGIREKSVRASDVAILYRTNALSRGLEHALRVEGVPYQIVQGMEFYRRKEIKDVLAYLQLLDNPKNDTALLRVINEPPRGVGRVSLQRLQAYAAEHHLCLLDACRAEAALAGLPKRTAGAIRGFVARLDRLLAAPPESPSQRIEEVIQQMGYLDYLREADTELDQQRRENVEELISAARDFETRFPESTVEDFLEQAALRGETDDWNETTERVTLMTLHAAKGLEFPHVFIVAVEQNILPHERSLNDPASLEEERRLLFVGITRAKTDLQLSFVRRREYRGNSRSAIPSEFIREVRHASVDYRIAPPLEGDHDRSSPSADGRMGIASPPSVPPWHISESLPNLGGRIAPLRTAADLLRDAAPTPAAESPKPEVNEHTFQAGMLVQHPKYGLGRVISLSGGGKTQTGQIQFFQPPQQKSFRLRASQLSPVASGDHAHG